jgi:hypothetical protein
MKMMFTALNGMLLLLSLVLIKTTTINLKKFDKRFDNNRSNLFLFSLYLLPTYFIFFYCWVCFIRITRWLDQLLKEKNRRETKRLLFFFATSSAFSTSFVSYDVSRKALIEKDIYIYLCVYIYVCVYVCVHATRMLIVARS